LFEQLDAEELKALQLLRVEVSTGAPSGR